MQIPELGEPNIKFGTPVIPEAAAQPDIQAAEAIKGIGGELLRQFARDNGVSFPKQSRNRCNYSNQCSRICNTR